jgi:hypothetical protein
VVAVAALLRALVRAGARHPDLNAKNVYLSRADGAWTAYVLDVDRVRFGAPDDGAVAVRNLTRLLRSLRKRRTQAALAITDDQLDRLRALSGAAA